MAGTIDNNTSSLLNNHRATRPDDAPLTERGAVQQQENGLSSSSAVTDQVDISAAGVQLNAGARARSPGDALHTPEDAAAMAVKISQAIQADGARALFAQSGNTDPSLHVLQGG